MSFLELAVLPSAVPSARRHSRLVLLEWNLGGLADDAELIVSELTTNAIRASGRPVGLSLTYDRDALVIKVRDRSREAPRPAPHAIDAESGRGLEIVAGLSDDWGASYAEAGGKVVWARLRTGSRA
jgi:anti-sigma regulatory factor (Ser/Thr protein kinase)